MHRASPLWTDGLQISAHHFQAQDRYHEDSLRERVATIRRFDWGITDIELDERLLQTGHFALRRLAGIWPDGLIVRCGPAGEALPAPRPFEPHLPADDASLDVFVGVRAEGTGNVDATGQAHGQQRFLRVVRSTENFNAPADVQDVEYLTPNLQIVFGSERRDGMVAIPVAQLVRQPNGRVAVRDAFVPPVLAIAAAPSIEGGLRRLLGAVIARQRDLQAARKQRSAAAVEFHFTDVRAFWLLHTLSGAIPVLSYLLDAERTHPEEVYLALIRLGGQLSTFSADTDLAAPPPFEYGRLEATFTALFDRILRLLAIEATPVYTEIPLQRRSDGMFVGRFPDAGVANDEFFVAVRSTLPEAQVRDRVPQLLKVADWKRITEVVKQARVGVAVDVEWHPSSSLPVKPGVCFFRLRREGPFWEGIAKTSTLALYLPGDQDWRDATVAVYAADRAQLK
jgi:type VI secretion system protein ImpJ